MKTLMLRGGDLDLSTSGGYRTIEGPGKVAQDLRGALLEPLGNDRFHPGWGSTLDDQVGGIVDETSRMSVTAEVNRVVANYASVQRDRVEQELLSQDRSNFTIDEIVSKISSIDVTPSLDAMRVVVTVGVASGDTVTLDEDL